MTVNIRTEMLFPPRLIAELKDLRGDQWRALIERISTLKETDADTLAFCLMMIRLSGCMTCFSGSYRFMRGCYLCAQQAVARYQGTDEELLQLYDRAQHDMNRYLDYLEGRVDTPPIDLTEWVTQVPESFDSDLE